MKVAIIGHGILKETDKLKDVLNEELKRLVKNGADTFYFGSERNFFDYLCYEAVEELMQTHNVKRVLSRARCEFISDDNLKLLIDFTENKSFSENEGVDIREYFKPVIAMIDLCDVLFTYDDFNYFMNLKYNSRRTASFAARYAKHKKKRIINIYELL